jgi:hypothetical protein
MSNLGQGPFQFPGGNSVKVAIVDPVRNILWSSSCGIHGMSCVAWVARWRNIGNIDRKRYMIFATHAGVLKQ